MCVLCEKVKIALSGDSKFLIKEFKNSILIVGEHQYFPGYCQLILKQHVADLTDLEESTQAEFFNELMLSARAVRKAFNPARLNYSSLGNVVPHIHFHLFPRYQDELEGKSKLDPWADALEFTSHQTRDKEYDIVGKKVLGHL